MLGNILKALRPARRAPRDIAAEVESWMKRGIAHHAAGDFADAVICFERALGLEPGNIAALHARAVMHNLAGEHDEAVALATEVVTRAPGHVDAWCTLAGSERARGRLDAALAAFCAAAAAQPRADLLSSAGGILFQQGRIAEALAETERALALDPQADAIHSNRLFILNHDARATREAVAEAHFAWGRDVEARKADRRRALDFDRDPDRRLRVGYVSADFRKHSVAFFIAPVLEYHDRRAVEVFCYDNQDRQGDSYTRRLQARADHWVRIAHLDDDALAERIRTDRIDILVDLSGHTGGNRLPVFAMKPAPVSATWFGYMNTTGLSTVDYRISDAALCPPGCERFYSEAIMRLPSAAAWSPAPDAPEPGPAPCERNGHVRFGSFNNWTKVSDAVLGTWARLLARVPTARLLVIAGGGDEPAGRESVQERFARHGVEATRIEVSGTRALEGFLELVRSVDIALDPFPYNGGTTTLHTLWMGVPVVSMGAPNEIGRVSIGLLAGVGLANLCAHDVEGYVERAAALAEDRVRLAGLRAGLRERMRASPSMNGAETTSNLEKAYRAMWHNRLKV